jgi:rhomboid family GlyGly-CTERM serine protease
MHRFAGTPLISTLERARPLLLPRWFAWLSVCGLLGSGSLLALFFPGDGLAWSRTHAGSQVWRLVSAAWPHLSLAHLLLNLAALAAVAALGMLLRVRKAQAVAWLVCWPLTHAALWLQPEISRYAGMSGALHAGVAICAVAACREPDRLAKAVGGMLLAGLALKVLIEAPWSRPLQESAALGITMVPLAHAAGAALGLLAGVVALLVQRQR